MEEESASEEEGYDDVMRAIFWTTINWETHGYHNKDMSAIH